MPWAKILGHSGETNRHLAAVHDFAAAAAAAAVAAVAYSLRTGLVEMLRTRSFVEAMTTEMKCHCPGDGSEHKRKYDLRMNRFFQKSDHICIGKAWLIKKN